jgi:hypothetical protein
MMTWWGFQVFCPTCKKETTLQNFMFAADGELQFIGYCPDDKILITYKCYSTYLMWQANQNDLKKEREGRKSLKPPLMLPMPSKHEGLELTEEDKKFLKDLGTDPGGTK